MAKPQGSGTVEGGGATGDVGVSFHGSQCARRGGPSGRNPHGRGRAPSLRAHDDGAPLGAVPGGSTSVPSHELFRV